MQYNPTKISLKNIAEDNLIIYKGTAKNKQIELSTLIDENLYAYADHNMITTVVRNLVSNALKFTNLNGKVSISAENKDDMVMVSVCDSGVGIKQENIPKLFRIDVHHSTIGTHNEKGTGLGLMLCKEFIERNKGKIWVESTIGKGSEFHFTLPIQNGSSLS